MNPKCSLTLSEKFNATGQQWTALATDPKFMGAVGIIGAVAFPISQRFAMLAWATPTLYCSAGLALQLIAKALPSGTAQGPTV